MGSMAGPCKYSNTTIFLPVFACVCLFFFCANIKWVFRYQCVFISPTLTGSIKNTLGLILITVWRELSPWQAGWRDGEQREFYTHLILMYFYWTWFIYYILTCRFLAGEIKATGQTIHSIGLKQREVLSGVFLSVSEADFLVGLMRRSSIVTEVWFLLYQAVCVGCNLSCS